MKTLQCVVSVVLVLIASGCGCGCARAASAAVVAPEATMRKVVLEKAGAGYRWKIVQASIPAIGDNQVLVRVHAVGLNRGELS